MRRVVWEPAALQEFEEALRFTAEQDEAAAFGLQQKVDAALARLQRHSIGRPGRLPSIFEKSVTGTSYIIAYSIDGDELSLLRFIHQSRDWPKGGWPKGSGPREA